MRAITPELLAGLKSEQYIPVVAISLVVYSTTLRYSSWGTNITFGANIYEPRGLSLTSIRYGSTSIVDNVSAEIDDVDREVFFALSTGSSTTKPKVDISILLLDSLLAPIPNAAANIFTGVLGEWSYTPGSVHLKVLSIFSQWGNVTTAKFSGSCRWNEFKGSYCKYVGAVVTCDRTYATCSSLGNTNNYGGFRWLPSLQGKTIKLD